MRITFSIVAFVSVLQACGGGGGNDDAGTVSFDLNAAQTSLITTAQSFSATAASGTDTYQMLMTSTPATDAFFEGATRKRATQTLTFRKNGAELSTTSFDGFYQLNPFQLIGGQYIGEQPAGTAFDVMWVLHATAEPYPDKRYKRILRELDALGIPRSTLIMPGAGSGYLVSTTPGSALPTAASIGASGPMGMRTLYLDSIKMFGLARLQSAWTLEPAPAPEGQALFCVSTVQASPAYVVIDPTTACLRVTPSGTITGIRYTVAIDGLTLTFQ